MKNDFVPEEPKPPESRWIIECDVIGDLNLFIRAIKKKLSSFIEYFSK